MKVALIAPLWEAVPPKTYGGTELVVHQISEELTKRGHEVTVFACGESKISARLISCIEKPMREAGSNFPELHEMNTICKLIEMADEFDIIHNHIGFQFLPFASLIDTPVVTTLHGAFVNEEEIEFCKQYKQLPYISISNYQRKGAPFLNYISNVYNGINISNYPFYETPNTNEPYFAFLGRLCQQKGTHLAIEIAKKSGIKLVMAGKVGEKDRDYYEKEVKPHIDGENIIYVGEVGLKAKCELFGNAIANLHTVTWPEPFGLTLTESMLCGTPVLALRDGSIPEVVKHCETGFVADDIDELFARIKDIDKIDRKKCREHVVKNFSTEHMVDGYIRTYRMLTKDKPFVVQKSSTATLPVIKDYTA